MCVACSTNKCRIQESDLRAACLYIIFYNGYYFTIQHKRRPSERFLNIKIFQTACLSTIIVTYAITACSVSTTTGCLGFNTAYNTPVGRLPAAIASKLKQPTIDFEGRLIPIQKSKLTRRRAANSTDSTARRDNEVRLFFWIGITGVIKL